MRNPLSKLLTSVVLTGIILCLALILFNRWNPRGKHPDADYLSLLQEAYSAVTKHYVDKPDDKKMAKSMIDGMLASLDPHSAYLPPEPYKEMEVQMSGAFGGVGIELGTKDGRLTVIAPIDDTPAFRAGIQANDHIWKIDGTPTLNMNISAAVKRMRGEKGTPVTLTILRGDSSKPLVYNLIRDIIKIKSVKSRLLDQGYGFIRIAQFQERTGSEFKQALQELNAANGGHLKGLVIDLRYNPGGLLGSCIDVANCFIGDDIKNTLIVSTKGRLPESNHAFNATLGSKESRYPIVVLINGGSASASEIVAGALQDHKRAIIMGKQSFGKGSVQSIFPMRENAALKLTTARYYTPSGRSIQAKGIVPDIVVDSIKPVPAKGSVDGVFKENDLENRLAPEGGTEPLRKEAVPVQKAAPAPAPQKSVPVSPHTATRDVDPDKDYQLNRALELLRSLSLLKEQGFS
ncbi:MAG: S41 family peptidase [Desulfuromonadales bacterium]|nr:S41 family peptidase [Desulfuromonadales bacterium]